MTLPTGPTVNTVESMTPDRIRAILYGLPGAGKTTLAAGWFPATNLILECDPGGTRFLPGSHFVQPCPTYVSFTQAVTSLVTEDHPYTTVTIDTGDSLFRAADNEAGQRHGKIAAGLVDFGKGTEDRDATILRDLKRLLATDMGVIMCAHPEIVETKVGDKTITSIGPRIVRKAKNDIRQEIVGLFDYELYVRKSDHQIVTGGDASVDTKRRVLLPDVLPADAGALYQALSAGIAAAAAPVAV